MHSAIHIFRHFQYQLFFPIQKFVAIFDQGGAVVDWRWEDGSANGNDIQLALDKRSATSSINVATCLHRNQLGDLRAEVPRAVVARLHSQQDDVLDMPRLASPSWNARWMLSYVFWARHHAAPPDPLGPAGPMVNREGGALKTGMQNFMNGEILTWHTWERWAQLAFDAQSVRCPNDCAFLGRPAPRKDHQVRVCPMQEISYRSIGVRWEAQRPWANTSNSPTALWVAYTAPRAASPAVWRSAQRTSASWNWCRLWRVWSTLDPPTSICQNPLLLPFISQFARRLKFSSRLKAWTYTLRPGQGDQDTRAM